MAVDVSHLRSIAKYNPDTGEVIWKRRNPESFRCVERERSRVSSRWNKAMPGRVAGSVNGNGYVVITIEGKTYAAHRISWAIHYGEWPSGSIDHINGVRDDNRLENLRIATPKQNSKNRKTPKNNSSGSMGVHFHKGSQSWHARIMVDGVRIHLGSFQDRVDAACAYEKACEKYNFHENHGRR